MTKELMDKMEAYEKITGDMAPMFICFGSAYEEDYIAWLDKAISRKKAFTDDEIGEFLKDKSFDIADDNGKKDFDRGFGKGMKEN